jgi:hypothetical protein
VKKFIACFSIVILQALLFLPVDGYAAKAVVIFKEAPCKHFVAEGPDGFYLLEWQGGYDPEKGDFIVGNFNSYGFKQAYYPDKEQDGKVYVNGFKMSQDNALQEYFDHCQ